MSIEPNHTIVHVKDRWAAAREVGRVLGLPEAVAYEESTSQTSSPTRSAKAAR
jgi:hypothetical protein